MVDTDTLTARYQAVIDSVAPRVIAVAATEGNRAVDRPSLDALGVQLCLSVSYLSQTAPETVFAEILAECGLELSTRDGGLLSRNVLADIAVEFGLAVVFDGMPPAGSIIAILADVAAPFSVTVNVPAAHRSRVA